MSIGRIVVLGTALLIGAGAADIHAAPRIAAASTKAGSPAFDRFVDRLAADWMRHNPAAATAQQYFSGDEQDALDRELTAEDAQYGMPLGTVELAAFVARARAGLQGLNRFRRDQLSPGQRVSRASLAWQLEDALRIAATSDQRLVFEQFRGLQVALVSFLSQIHPLRTARDVDNYLARLGNVAPVLDEGIEIARSRAAEGNHRAGIHFASDHRWH